MCRRQAGPRGDADVGHVVVAVVATFSLRASPAGLMRLKRKDRARGALRARSVRCTRPVSQGGVTKFAAAGCLVRERCRVLHVGDPVRDMSVSNMDFFVSESGAVARPRSSPGRARTSCSSASRCRRVPRAAAREQSGFPSMEPAGRTGDLLLAKQRGRSTRGHGSPVDAENWLTGVGARCREGAPDVPSQYRRDRYLPLRRRRGIRPPRERRIMLWLPARHPG